MNSRKHRCKLRPRTREFIVIHMFTPHLGKVSTLRESVVVPSFQFYATLREGIVVISFSVCATLKESIVLSLVSVYITRREGIVVISFSFYATLRESIVVSSFLLYATLRESITVSSFLVYPTLRESIVVNSLSLILHEELSPAPGPYTLSRSGGYFLGLLSLSLEKSWTCPDIFNEMLLIFLRFFPIIR